MRGNALLRMRPGRPATGSRTCAMGAARVVTSTTSCREATEALDGPLPDELTDLLDQTYQLMTAAERRFLEGVRAFAERELFRADGARTMLDWLSERYSMERGRARGYVTVALGIEALPELSAAYEEGRVSLDQLRHIVPVAEATSDDALAREVPGWSVAQCRQLASRLRRLSREEAGDVHRGRFFRLWRRHDRLVLSGELTAEDGAVVEEALTSLAKRAGQNEDGTFDPLEARLADALVEVCSGSLARGQQEEADAATVICHVDARTLAGLEGEGELAGGQQLASETVRRLLCDCRFQIVKENEDGEPIGLGRSSRVVPSWLRRLLAARDGGCRFPGCPRERFVDRHHIEHWGRGGATDPQNLLQLCRHHHRLVHEEGWRIEGDPAGETRFVSPLGHCVTSRPSPPRRDVLDRFGLWRDDEGGG